jgi:hypothetical protein
MPLAEIVTTAVNRTQYKTGSSTLDNIYYQKATVIPTSSLN